MHSAVLNFAELANGTRGSREVPASVAATKHFGRLDSSLQFGSPTDTVQLMIVLLMIVLLDVFYARLNRSSSSGTENVTSTGRSDYRD